MMRRAPRHIQVAILVLCGAACLIWAQEYTAAQRVTNFTALLGTGNYCKLAWQTGNSILGVGTSIKFMDSKDGNVVTLETGANVMRPTFTWDGKAVIYNKGPFDGGTYSSCETHIVDITVSPATDKVLLTDFVMCACWADASTNKQYVVGTKLSQAKMYLVDLSNTATQQAIANPGGCAPIWTGLSTDKKWLAGDFCGVAALGVVQLNPSNLNQAVGTMHSYSPNGCWSTIARDATGDCLHQVEMFDDPVEGHCDAHQGYIFAKTNDVGNAYISLLKAGADNFTPPLSGAECYTVSRWSNSRDYLTASRQGADDSHVGTGAAPFVYRISNRHWTSIYKNNTESAAETDMYWYSSTNVVSTPKIQSGAERHAGLPAQTFDVGGRVVAGSKMLKPGVYVSGSTAMPGMRASLSVR